MECGLNYPTSAHFGCRTEKLQTTSERSEQTAGRQAVSRLTISKMATRRRSQVRGRSGSAISE
ncbi:hypothetical protein ABTA76_19970, partial [Acinetobacter baumannii]